jgi:hypothetical protein
MLTGTVPFDGVGPVDVLHKHVHDAPPSPRSINPTLPAAVEPVLLKSLEKNPAARYQSAEEMAQALKRLVGQIERLNAQRQLHKLLQQPAADASGSASANPYTTRTLPDIRSPTPFGANLIGRSRQRWMYLGVPALLVLLALMAILMAREVAGGQASPPGVATTPTEVPVAAITATNVAPPTEAVSAQVTALPTEQLPPTLLATPGASASTPQETQNNQPVAIRFEDTDWQGGFRRASGGTYGGRTATWIYGTSTSYSSMHVSFDLKAQPAGTATLTVEGMDSEDRLKTPISIQVNGVEIFNGPNPLPDDDHPLETGTWASYSWPFDARLLHPGSNQISIANLAPGAFSLPPFFMLDYADLSYATR